MKSLGKVILYGIIIWAVTFVVAFMAFPLRETSRPLFESIMPVVLATMTMVMGTLYVKNSPTIRTGKTLLVGVIWLAINIAIDLPLMLTGPMKMSFGDYLADIALTYLIIPIIMIGLGWVSAPSPRSN